mgnify:FL=1
MKIQRVPTKEILTLRRDVLRPGMDVKAISYEQDDAPGSFSLGVFEDGKYVACVTFLPVRTEDLPQEKQYQMRALCTDPAYRGRGYATALILEGWRQLKDMGVQAVWFHARHYLLDFYRSFGCVDYGELFPIPDSCEYKNMYKIL